MVRQAPTATSEVSTERLFDRLLRDRDVRAVFQPIVRLDSREVVGFESLARGPEGSPLESPAELFAEAARQGKTNELNWVCRATALRSFVAAELPPTVALLSNVDPESFGSECPPDLAPIVGSAGSERRMMVELTERAVVRDPARLLNGVEDLRQQSIGIALDDVGVEPASLAMMPLIHPDLIKLDLSLIQQHTTPAVARVVNAVMAETERTGALILAEGIETESHASVAQALGAELGQGWLFGRPGPIPQHVAPPRYPIDQLPPPMYHAHSPFDAVAGRRMGRTAEHLLLPMTVHLEYRVLNSGEPTVLLACFQDARRFNDAARRRYAHLASRATFTAVVGRDMPADPGPGIRGAQLDPDDPIVDEWSVVVLGPHIASALVAKESEDEVSNGERMFDFTITHDRARVIDAAGSILKRVLAAG